MQKSAPSTFSAFQKDALLDQFKAIVEAGELTMRSDSEDRQWARWDSAIDRISIKYGLHLDDWKRLGPNQMGKPCGRGWVGLRGACKRGKKSEDNTAKIKASKAALADRIRARKNMSTIRSRNGKTAQGDWDIGAAFAPAKELQSSIRAKRTSPAKTKMSPDPDRASRMMNKESERARINWGRSTGDWKQKPDSTAAMDFPKPKQLVKTTPTPISAAKARPLKMYEQAFRSLASVDEDLENAQANYDRLSQKTTKGAAQAKSRVEAEISKLERRRENLKEALVQTNIGGKSVRIISAGKDPDGSTTALFKMAGEKRGETISASIRFKDGEVEHLPPATINGKIFSKDKAVFDHVKANAKESKEFADFVDRAVPSSKKPVDVSLLNEINSVPTMVNGIPSERASLSKPTPIESGKSLKSLFAEADRIGSKYQDEPTSLEERRSAKQGADRILQESGVTEAVARSTGVASMAKARDRRVSKEDKIRATESPSEASRRLFENAPVAIASNRRKSGEPRKRGRSVD